MIKLTTEDLFAERLGIVKYCVNCGEIISITDSEADFKMTNSKDKNLWIHNNSRLRRCSFDSYGCYAFPRRESRFDGVEKYDSY